MMKILLLEPFYSGSHKVLIDLLAQKLNEIENIEVVLLTLPGKKWHWRARTSALYFAQNIPSTDYKSIFVSSVLPLHELIGIRPDLAKTKKVVYFHENQLTYPIRKQQDRDFQYGYNQIMSCLAADVVLFNSKFNMTSFLENIKPFFKLQPDFRPKNLKEQLEGKCNVLYFPMDFSSIQMREIPQNEIDNSPLKIVWPHRWEFDKNPDLLFRVLYRLHDDGFVFKLSILGEQFTTNPPIFEEAKEKLSSCIDHYGKAPKDDYYNALRSCDIVISTADHEFFGVAMIEATYCGCFPLCPNKLVYPEIFTDPTNLYSSENDLYSKLKSFMQDPKRFRDQVAQKQNIINFEFCDWDSLKSSFVSYLCDD